MTPRARKLGILKSVSLQYRRVSDLKPDLRNARMHPAHQIAQIAESLKQFGFLIPVLVDSNGKIIAGHGRVLAAEKLGLKEVPVICVTHLTDAQIKAFAIADNRLTENSRWDNTLLAQNLKELSLLDLDFSLEITGFSMAEIDMRIEGLSDAPEQDPADEIPAPGPAVAQLGDAFVLGPHRVYCGDARSAQSYVTLMGPAEASVVITDPPFNVRIQGHAGGKGRIKHREFAMASGEMSSDQFEAFLLQVLGHMAQASKPGALHYVAMDWRHLPELLTAGMQVYEAQKNLCVWVKPSGGMGSLYRSRHELFLVFKVAGGKHRNNVELGRHGRNRTNVWEYPGVTPFGQATDEGNLLSLHPTVKPVRLVADALLDCSARGDIVLDPFLGSGTTLIAAQRVGRVCYGMELEPGYVDTAVRRWEAWTGEQAVHEGSGRTFAQLAKGGRRGR